MKGLILAGGDGSRLGMEKAMLNFHGQTQIAYLTNEFRKLHLESYVSAPEKKRELFEGYELIPDVANIKGPLAGISAAFKSDPGPWIVFAVDMPFVNASVIQYLMDQRRPAIASCFTTDGINPEPLACIWEQDCRHLLEKFVGSGGESPSEFLKTHSVNLIKVKDNNWVKSINTKEELQQARKLISG